jgi:hypothetical protein
VSNPITPAERAALEAALADIGVHTFQSAARADRFDEYLDHRTTCASAAPSLLAALAEAEREIHTARLDIAAAAVTRDHESHDAAPGEDGTATRKDAAPALEGVGFLGSPSPGAAPSPPGDVRAAVAHTATLRALFDCARAWEPNARLLGNVRAGDAVAALDAVLRAALAGQGSCSEIPKSSTPPGDRWTLLADNPETWPDNSCEMVCVSRLPGSRETWRATDLRGLVADGRAIGWRWHPWPPHAQGGGAG